MSEDDNKKRRHLRLVGPHERGRPQEDREVLHGPRWLGIPRAAPIIGMTDGALRRAIERRARRRYDGSLEAVFDGIRARKLGGRWRVLIGDAWMPSEDDEKEKNKGARATSSSRPSHATRPEKE